MIDIDINRYCELINLINSLNTKLKIEKEDFYDGGHSFEEIHTDDINLLISYQNELKDLIKKIY